MSANVTDKRWMDSNTTDISVNASLTSMASDLMTDTADDILAKREISAFSAFYYMAFAAILAIVVMVSMAAIIVRKKRLDHLRHHLMPVYNFDAADEGEDWETELLDESVTSSLTRGPNLNKSRQLYTNERPNIAPQLTFARV